MPKRRTRREALKAAGVIAGTTILTTSPAAAQTTANIVLGGRTGGWVGREPQSIEGVKNPSLDLTPGQDYTIAWENADGAPHNIAFKDQEGNNVVESPIISGNGKWQVYEFTATEEMVEYYCVVHPGSMEGPVEFTDGGANTETFTVETPTPTATATATSTPTATATPTPTETPTATAAPQAAETDAEPTETSSGSGPGLGVGTALAGLGGAAAYLLRNRNRE